ncbi:MAG TPA: hypothetical protein VIA02_03565 [Candidatus Limnocylindria bacterium]
MGVAAIAVLSGWILVELRNAAVGPVPFNVLWAAAVGAFFGGFAVATPRYTLPPRGLGSALLGVVVVVAGSVAATRLVWDGSERLAAGVAVLMAGAFVAGVLARNVWPKVATATLVLVVEVFSLWALLDGLRLIDGAWLYDFRTYLASGAEFAAGENPYLSAPLTVLEADPAAAGFLSSPILLPVFAVLAALPYPVAATAWVAMLVACAVAGLRLLGLPWRWAVLLVASPMLFPESGNLANVIFLLLCLGPAVGGALVQGAIFKLQAGIPAAWLVRERRWRDLGIGLLALIGLALITLPLVGLGSWSDYVVGLEMRARSQENLPILYGLSLAQWLPWAAFIGLSAAAVIAGALLAGRRGLSGLGLATIVASPSLWAHGFAAAIPAMLFLDAPLFWLALGIGSTGYWLWVLLIAGVWGIWRARQALTHDDPLHPLAGRTGPWEAWEPR